MFIGSRGRSREYGRRIAMGIALTLQEYLDDHHVPYDVMRHKRTHCAYDTARASHVPGDRLAKAVVLTREGGFVVAIVPATARVRLDIIERALRCHVDLATEDEICELFPDCDPGAVPPVADAYAVDTFIDESFDKQPEIYLEGGDHRSLVHMTGESFRALMKDARRASIAA
jgi:Ala-tRNA(Pro) deacylase